VFSLKRSWKPLILSLKERKHVVLKGIMYSYSGNYLPGNSPVKNINPRVIIPK
jgi:hypothetical protein